MEGAAQIAGEGIETAYDPKSVPHGNYPTEVRLNVLKFLEARGIPVSETQRQEILRCQDLDRLNLWLDRAAVASSADEVTSEP